MGKKLILLMVLLLTLVGCSTYRVQRDTTERIDFSQSDMFSLIKRESYNQSIFDSICAIRDITFRIYDTDKPPNESGEYPVRADGTIHGETSNVRISTETRTDTIFVRDTIYSHVETNKTSHTRKNAKHPFATFVCAIVAVITIIISCKIYRNGKI